MSSSPARPFRQVLLAEVRLFDLLLLALVPAVLVGAFQFPSTTRTDLAFAVSEPTVVTAYTSYFTHLAWSHLLGNLLVYLVVAPLSYLLLAASGRQQLFRWSFLTFVAAFPFALTVLQLIFPRARVLLGFSGLNAAFFGLLSVAVVSYAGTTLSAGIDERDAPVLLFFTIALIALVALPPWAWRVEIALFSAGLGVVHLAAAVAVSGIPSRDALRAAIDSPGYFELAGGSLGVVFAYPLVGFQSTVVDGVGVVDVYVHLLGYCLAFIVVYVFVVVVDPGGPTGGERPLSNGLAGQ